MKVEYLIVFKKGTTCNSIKTFKNLLQADDLIVITNNLAKYEGIELGIQIGFGELGDKSQKFFQLEVEYNESHDIDLVQDFLRKIRALTANFEGDVNILWDDIGLTYAKTAYPAICDVENLLRKLISKFMVTSIGTNWTKDALPNEVKEAVTKAKRSNGNPLHNVDFINLADFLFKPYQSKAVVELYEKIKKSDTLADLNLDDLKSYLPKSNWQRYFKSVVNCEDEFLLKRWTKLYELRCLVAHNNFISKLDFDDIISLISQIKEPLNEAIKKINEIIIPDDEKEQIVENVAGNLNESVGIYINEWKDIEREITGAYKKHIGGNDSISVKSKVMALIKKGLLSEAFLNELQPLGEFRNLLVHGNLNSEIDKESLQQKNSEISRFYGKHIFLESPFFS